VASTPSLTWTGATSIDWSECSNWPYGMVPAGSQRVVIPAGLSRYPTLSNGTAALAGLMVASGASFTLASAATLQITGNVDNQGPALAGTVLLNGTTAQTVAGSFGTLTVNKASGTTSLSAAASVSTALMTTSGELTTGSYALTLGSSATLTEGPSSYVTGTVQTTRDLSAAGANAFGGLGLSLNPAAGSLMPGSTLLRRITGSPVTGVLGRQGIARYFDIQPAVNTGLSVSLALSYRDAELNGIPEANLLLFKSETSTAGPWAPQRQATLDAATNTVSLTGIASFSLWTLGNTAAPLPVELAAFTATAEGPAARLRWTTASEKNSARFDIERSLDGQQFSRVGELAAQGTKTSLTDYTYLDPHTLIPPYPHTPLYYRLRQVDLDGTASYSPVHSVTLEGKTLLTLYPNPAHGTVAVGGLAASTAVEVFDALGRVVAQATADAAGTAQLALPAGLAAGMYVVRSGSSALRLTVE
jgi:hypothetical protein